MAYSEKTKAQQAEYRAKNSEKIKARRAEYRAKNAEEIKSYNAKYHSKNAKTLNAARKEYRAKNAEEIESYRKVYRNENPDRNVKYYLKNKCGGEDAPNELVENAVLLRVIKRAVKSPSKIPDMTRNLTPFDAAEYLTIQEILFACAIHPGEVLDELFLQPLGMSAGALAKQIGVPRTRIKLLLNGKTTLTADMALRLSAFFSNTAEFWMNLQRAYDQVTK